MGTCPWCDRLIAAGWVATGPDDTARISNRIWNIDAKLRLLASGRTKGSPTLDSFGPNMSLAKDLLERGEREVVLEYFKLCSAFWKRGADRLDAWTAEIKQGQIPDFGANLDY